MPKKDHAFYDERYGNENFIYVDGQYFFAPYPAWYDPYLPYDSPDDYDSFYSSEYSPAQHPGPTPRPGRPRQPERPRHRERPRERDRRRQPEPPRRPRIYGPPDPYGRREILPPLPPSPRINVTGTYDFRMGPFYGEMSLQQARDDRRVRGYYLYRRGAGEPAYSGSIRGTMYETPRGNELQGSYYPAEDPRRATPFRFLVTEGPEGKKEIRGLFAAGELTGTQR